MKFTKIIFSIFILAFLTLPLINLSAADQVNPKSLTDKAKGIMDTIGNKSGYGLVAGAEAAEQSLAYKVGRVAFMVLSVFGVVFLGLVIFSGIQWMTAGGNEEKVSHARDRIIRAAIGLGIIMMSYALTHFIVTNIQQG